MNASDHAIEIEFRNQYGDRIVVLTCPVDKRTECVKRTGQMYKCPCCGTEIG